VEGEADGSGEGQESEKGTAELVLSIPGFYSIAASTEVPDAAVAVPDAASQVIILPRERGL
jgi:hypothetical protein